MRARFFPLLLTPAVMLSGCNSSAPASAQQLRNGGEQYAANCAICHGVKGFGDGPAAAALPKRPANLVKKLSSPFNRDSALIEDVKRGKQVMPAFAGKLSDDQIADIFAYIRSLNP
ncbi:MAG: c-type cytochrome [Pseudomonadales bacterium]